MSVASKRVVHSLLAAVLFLLLGIMALLGVAYQRHQRLNDATVDLQRNRSQQESRIKKLQQQLVDCNPVSTSVAAKSDSGTTFPPDSVRVISQAVSAQN